MKLDFLKGAVKDAALLNIRFYSSLIDLEREYLASLKAIVVGGASEARQSTSPEKNQHGTPVVPPMVLSGRAGETVEHAFQVVNHLKQRVSANASVAGDVPVDNIRIEPAGKVFEPGEEGVFKIYWTVDETVDVMKDRHGALSIPDLASQSIPLVLRRLPDDGSSS